MAAEDTTKTADQLELENKQSETEKRIKQLSEKVRLTSEERDEKVKLIEERDKKIAELERENSFNSGFVDVLGTHAAAKDHKDEIKAKVISGYSIEDATYAVLGKAGKLGGAPSTQQETKSPAGGSAPTTATGHGTKPVSEMSLEEKRAQLAKDLIWQ